MIDYFSLGHPLSRLRSRYAQRARERMLRLFLATFQPTPETRVLDLGVTPDQSLPESNYFERHYPYPERIVAASIEDISALQDIFPRTRMVRIAPGPLPFADQSFDIVFCSAVLEHVGSRDRQQQFVRELLRVGRAYFLTTPDRRVPVEFHTLIPLIHWLPQSCHQQIHRVLGLEFWSKTDNLNLLTGRELMEIFPPASRPVLKKITTCGWPSNLVAFGLC